VAGKLLYLDSSVIVKLVVPEPETKALRELLRSWPDRVSSVVARIEVERVARRIGGGAVRRARTVLSRIALVDLDEPVVEVHERDSREDGPRSPDGATADPSRDPFHLDPSHHTRHPVGPGSKELAKGFRLGLGYDELHDDRGVEVQELPGHGLRAVLADLPEGVGAIRSDRPLLAGRGRGVPPVLEVVKAA